MRRQNVTNRVGYVGVGRGPKTRDGCSVELYLRLPYCGEVELIERCIPKGASVIELGCGVGRITRELLTHGYRVTAVDNSPEMLAYVPLEASKICADIEGLAIDEMFDAVILASCLVNTPDVALRLAQLTKCQGLLKPAGHLLLERFDPAWLANVKVGPLKSIGTIAMYVDEVRGSGAERELCFRYREGEDEWLQYFATTILDDEDICQCLSSTGFEPPDWINRRWASAQVVNNAT
jgi:SAM-dependent methyltransferase